MKSIQSLTIVLLFIVVSPFLFITDTNSSAITEDDFQFDVCLFDNDGKQIETITDKNTKVPFDTINDRGYVKYYLRSISQIIIPPTNLYIESDSGTFNSFVTITGLKSYLADSGIRMTITNGDQHYSADLTKENNFTSYFNNTDAYAVLDCNKPYAISMTTLGAIETSVAPEDITDISFTFTVHMAKGNHQVMFVSNDEVVEAYKVMDGYVIDKLPSVSRSGYDFKGWLLPDGREITEGFVVTENDGDIIATAQWESVNMLPIGITIATFVIAAIVVAGAIFFVIKKKRNNSVE